MMTKHQKMIRRTVTIPAAMTTRTASRIVLTGAITVAVMKIS